MLAILATAGEIRHRTLSGSLLLNPRRSVWLASQALAAVIGGLLLSLMVCIAIGLLGALLAVVHGVPVVPTVVGFGSRIAGLLAVTGAYALMGTAVAAAIGEQTVAIVAALGWDLVLETLLTGALPSVAPYLPGRLAMAIMGISDGRSLPISWAAALLYGYVTAASLLGVLLFRRRDITT
jgi:ABC-2 type transport system permease protein